MGVKKFKAITPGMRHKLGADFSEITFSKPEKSLLFPLNRGGGRNNQGRMTVRHVGGGHKRRWRQIDFKRSKHAVPARVQSIEYDPNRSARIALLFYKDGEKAYILAPGNLKVGQEVFSGTGVSPEVGNALPLGEIPMGAFVHNIELKPGRGAALVRSAGTSARLLAKKGRYVTIKLPSGESRDVLSTCYATVGVVSNVYHMNEICGKAGRARWTGRRPRVRGVAMNPVDHPMGGGEGKASGGHPRSRTGLYAKGKKTRAPRKYSDALITVKRKK